VKSLIAAVRDDCYLHFTNDADKGGEWFPSNGCRVSDQIAQVVIRHLNVISCGTPCRWSAIAGSEPRPITRSK